MNPTTNQPDHNPTISRRAKKSALTEARVFAISQMAAVAGVGPLGKEFRDLGIRLEADRRKAGEEGDEAEDHSEERLDLVLGTADGHPTQDRGKSTS